MTFSSGKEGWLLLCYNQLKGAPMKHWYLIPAALLMLAGCGRNPISFFEKDKQDVLYYDSLPEVLSLAGQSIYDLGLTEKDLESELFLHIETEFLSDRQEVTAGTDRKDRYVITGIWFSSSRKLSEAEEYFSGLYGEPYLKTEDPYAEGVGGVVYHQYWWTGEGIIHLSKAQKHRFFSFQYEKAAEPEKVAKREKGLSLQEFAWGTGYYMKLSEEDFDSLKIEKKDEEYYTWDFVFEGTAYHLDIYRKQGKNLSEYLRDVPYDQTDAGHEKLYTYVDSGYGEQVFSNPFSDVWRIVMEQDAASEKLNMIRELLENSSWKS